MAEALLDLPSDLEQGDDLADWAEAIMFLERRQTITRGELRRRLTGRSGDFEVGLLFESIRARGRQASSYPFQVEGNLLSRRIGVDATLYEFLLWASFPQSPVRLSHKFTAIDRFFDRVVLRAMCSYLGPNATGVRFGTPASDGRPKGFADALAWLADLMDVGAPGAVPPNDRKNDAGVDVIAWLPCPDGRSDFLVSVAQCTLRGSWENKAAELLAAAALWGGGWLALGRPPTTFLAVPFQHSSDAPRFSELRALVNVVFDRIRLCSFAEDVDPADKGEIETWSAQTREKMLKRTRKAGAKSKTKPKAKGNGNARAEGKAKS